MKFILFVVSSMIFRGIVFSMDTLTLEKEIYNKINSYRKAQGLTKLTYLSENVQSCRQHSKRMGDKWQLFHVSKLDSVHARAEIIQLNFTMSQTVLETAQSVLETFTDSPPHKNIMVSAYQSISVGVFITDDEDLWVTIRFY